MTDSLMRRVQWRELSSEQRARLLKRPAASQSEELKRSVAEIVRSVRQGGDEALAELTARFDRVRLASALVTEAEFAKAAELVSADVKAAIHRAHEQISRFHEAETCTAFTLETSPGLVCSRRPRPIARVGLYVPGGSAPLPSTVLMLGVPARLAGSRLKILATPPRPDGSVDPHILYAARLVGVDRVIKAGGAQAIAALAYGTAEVPKVDKIFGPGNAWVTEAKLTVALDPEGAACDMPAGPSEVMVIADDGADPRVVALDLLSQAEHGPDSQVMLVSLAPALSAAVPAALERALAELPRSATARAALGESRIIDVTSLEEAMAVANAYAPEHLILNLAEPMASAAEDMVEHAGSVFVGRWTPESLGDYASGTNHVLPTYGFARAYSGLSVEAFVKYVTFQRASTAALLDIGPTVERLAATEGLDAHRLAVTERLKKLAAEKE